MPMLSITHSDWQVLRAAKRAKKPPVGRSLRLNPTRGTKDGGFLNRLVRAGLLSRTSGTDKDPFLATYRITELGRYAAEYGEADINWNAYTKGT